jgi:transposase
MELTKKQYRQIAGLLPVQRGNVADARAGRLLLETVGPLERTVPLLMDRAYEDDLTRLTAWQLRFKAVVPPKRNRVKGWDYDEELYQRRNEVERLFRRLKGFRCVFTRYEPGLHRQALQPGNGAVQLRVPRLPAGGCKVYYRRPYTQWE